MVPFNNTTAATNGTEGPSGFNNKSVTNGRDDYGIEQFEESTGLYAFRLVLFSLIMLASLIGNSVVCKAVWSIPFHKPFSYQLVANMAFAEIINSLCLPFMLAGRETEDSVILRIKCVLNPLQVLCLMVETHSMAAHRILSLQSSCQSHSTRPVEKSESCDHLQLVANTRSYLHPHVYRI